ncbi:MAG: hypothetical protein HRU70_14950 [Phycisphaeraceae bacterium]|nr:MAG: hypothetical protein HRU70_14950 [Phycisphaeraceae bacterium]
MAAVTGTPVGIWGLGRGLGLGVLSLGLSGPAEGSVWLAAVDSFSTAASAYVVIAQPAAEAQPAAPAPAPVDVPAVAPAPRAEPKARLSLNFKDTPLDQVIDLFSREAGLPVIFEAPVPAGQLTFLSGQEYDFDDALSILNLNLSMRGVQLRRQDKFLFLASLEESQKKPGMVVSGELPPGVRPDEVLTLAIPLQHALADTVVKQIEPLRGKFGAVLAIPAQNMVVVTDTAAQCRRLQEIVRAIDQVKPADTQFRLFTLKHTNADVVVTALRGLVSQKIVREVVMPDGKRVVQEQQDLGGMNLYADARTNAVVAVGTTARLRIVEDLVAMLDVPEGAAALAGEMVTVQLSSVPADAAAAKVNDLFANLPPDRKPRVISLPQASKISIIGPRGQLAQAMSLLAAMDPGAVDEGTGLPKPESRATVLRLKHIDAAQAETLIRKLLTTRQTGMIRLAGLPDGRGLIVQGPADDVAQVEQIAAGLDVSPEGRREVRIVRLPATGGQALLTRVTGLYADRTTGMPEGEAGPVEWEIDAAGGGAILRGSASGLRVFTELLTQAQQLTPPTRTTRVIDVQQAKASDIVGTLRELLEKADSIDPAREVPAPVLGVIEQTNSLLVTAEDAQHAMVAEFVRRLDRIESLDLPPMKLLQLRTADADKIAGMLSARYGGRPQTERASKPVDVKSDAATNTLIVSAHPEPFEEIRAFVDDLNKERREGGEKETRLFPLKVAKAADIAAALDRLYPQPPVPVDRLGRPQPWLQAPKPVTVSADPNTNSLVVYADADQMASIKELADKLDTVELPPTAQLRTYRIQGPSLDAVKTALAGMAARGVIAPQPQPGKPPVPVIIDAEPRSSTLIVTGDETVFATVERVLADLSAVPIARTLRVYPIVNARATDVARRATDIYKAQTAGDPTATPAEITADDPSNTVSIVADEPGTARAARILDELQKQAGPAREIRMIELRVAKAKDVVAFLGDLVRTSETLNARGGPAPVFEAVEATNSVVVAATAPQLAVIDALVRNLDANSTVERPPLRVLRVVTSDAANLAQVLQAAYDKRSAEQRGRLPVDIQADAATNTLVVSAAEGVLPEIEAIVEQLNRTQAQDQAGREIRIFPLRHARAEALAETIDQMFPEPPVPLDPRTRQPRPDLRPPREVVVRAHRETNALIVDAPSKRLAGFEQIVTSLDQSRASGSAEVRTYRVVRADVDRVASTLRTLASGGGLPGVAPTTPVTVTAEPATRALVVSGPREAFAEIEKVLKDLDGTPAGPSMVVRVHPLSHARAEKLRPLLEQLLTARVRGEAPVGPGGAADVKSLLEVASDAATNSLIITAPEPIQAVAEELIRALDKDGPGGSRSMVRVVPLSFADASQTAETLRQAAAAMELPSGGTVSVVAAPGSNALLLAGLDADLAKVEELIRPLDVRPSTGDTPGVQTFTMKHADASVLARIVEPLLVEQQQTDPRILQLQLQYAARNRQDLFRRPSIKVEADTRSNSLIVSGPSSSLELAKAVIERLDQPAPQQDRVAATFTPAKGQAVALAAQAVRIVNATVSQTRGPVEMTAEPGSGAIVVIGTKAQVDESLATLATLDERSASMPAADLALIPLSHADAASVAGSVQGVLRDRGRWPSELLAAERAGLTVPTPTVNADAKGNRLVVSVPTVLMAMARELVGALDVPPAGGAVDVRVFSLSSGDANGIAAALGAALSASASPGEAAATVRAEPASNSVVVSGSARQLDKAEQLVAGMDGARKPDGLGVRTMYLKHTRAESIRPVVESVLTQENLIEMLPQWARAEVIARQGQAAAAPKVRVASEPRLNAIVVSGPRAILDLAEQVIAELDTDPAGRGPGEGDRAVRVIAVRNADAAELAENIEAVFKDEPSGSAPPTIRVDRGSNALFVRADAAQLRTIEALVRAVDDATLTSSRQMRMVPVDRSKADAAMVAETLRRMVGERGETGARVEVISTEELIRREREKAAPADGKPRGMLTPSAPLDWRAAAVAWGVFAAANEPADQPAAGDEADVTIAVDPATNSLMIVGSPRMTDRLAALARQLQDSLPAEPTKVRVVTLPPGVDAQALSQLIGTTVQQIGRVTVVPPQGDRPGRVDNPGGFSGAVSVLPDPSGGALVVVANETDFASVGSMIASVAGVADAGRLTIKVYPLTSVSARQAEDAVADLLRSSPQGAQARRMRSAEIGVAGADGAEIAARFDPASVRVTGGPGGASLIVAAPRESLAVIDRFISLIDQSPTEGRLAIRRYALGNAKAADLSRTLQSLFDAQRQGPGANETPQARFVPDERGNAILVTASGPQHEEVARLLESADASMDEQGLELAIIPLRAASASGVRSAIEAVIVGRDPGRRERLRLSAEEQAGVIVVRGPQEVVAEVRELVGQLDRADIAGLPVRSFKLERADAQSVAQSLTRFFQDRAAMSGRGGGRQGPKVAVMGDRRTGTVVVAAGEDELAQVESLITTFDAPTPMQDLQFKVIPLRHARVADIQATVQNLVSEFRWSNMWSGGEGRRPAGEQVYIETNERTNAVVLMGVGEMMAVAERMITQLDQPPEDRQQLVVRAVGVEKADLRAVKATIERAMATPGWRTWRGPDPDGVVVEIDQGRRSVVLVGKAERVAQAAAYVAELDAAGGRGDQKVETIALRHAKAGRAATTLRQFFLERARAQGLSESPVSILGSAEGNVLVVSADEAGLALVRDLIAQIDVDQLGQDRRTEVYVLQNITATEASNTLRSMFPRAGGEDERVVLTPQPAQNSILVSAPEAMFEQIAGLVRQLDAAPKPEQANIRTVTLQAARAQEVATALRTALPPNVKIAITAVGRSNSLMLTGSDEAINLALEQVSKLDTEKPRALTVFRRFKLDHMSADDASFTVRQMFANRTRTDGEATPSVDYDRASNTLMISASADVMPDIERMILSLDVAPDRPKRTDFVKLEYARAEQTAKALENFYGRYALDATPDARNVTIIPDPASNSLVISAEDGQWEGIRSLLRKLDTKEYDTAQQSEVIPLQHADAVSVARAINEGLRAPLQAELDRERVRIEREARGRQGRNNDEFVQPAVLIDAKDIPTVSAEPQTNSLVVFAGVKMLERIRALVRQLDVPALTNINDIRVVPLRAGKPTVIAQQIRTLFQNQGDSERSSRVRGVLVVGDDTAGALIVRAPDEEFAQIRALAESLQTAVDAGRVQPHVFRLTSVPAARLAPTIQRTFAPIAQQMGETLAVEVERGNNALVVACSDRLREQVARTIEELDKGVFGAGGVGEGRAPGAMGPGVFIVDLKHNSPARMRAMIEAMGLTRAQPADRPGVVTEPITVIEMATRQALAVLAEPGDAPAVISLVKALDAEPAESGEVVQIVRLKLAAAPALAQTLRELLDQSKAAQSAGPAPALAEHLRRLRLTRTGLQEADLEVDLSRPIRLVVSPEANAVIIGSTAGNVQALARVVETLDTLPLGEAVVIRMFPLQNALASRVKVVVDQLFAQGEALSRLPGTQRRGQPVTETGKALTGEVAVAIDERTNTIVVAGREEAVALVEVLVKNLDSDATSSWIEPAVIAIKHGDAGAISRKLNEVLVRGLATTPEAAGLQKQYGRLRLAQQGRDPSKPEVRAEADMFAPLNGLVITDDPALNALIVVGSPGNLAVVRELVGQLDVEAANANSAFRFFPLTNAAADRAARTVQEVFAQRERSGALRSEDRVVITSDARTNSVIVSSSARSLTVVETLLKTLDAAETNATVSIHVLPVEGADVTQLASRIERLMRERIEAANRGGAGGVANPMDAFRIEPEPQNSLLIVACSDENFAVVRDLVDALVKQGQSLAAGQETGLIQLVRTQAVDAATQVRAVYVDKENAKRGPNSVAVSVNERLNALMVTGTSRDVAEVRALVERMESTEVALVRELDRIELRSANALEIVNLLESVLSGRGVSGRQPVGRQATKIKYIRETAARAAGVEPDAPRAEAEIDGAIRDQVTLTPDLRTNAVLVNAPPQILALLREVIQDMDSTKADRLIEQFHLTNADAQKMAEVLRDVFTLRQQGQLFVLAPSEAEQPEDRPGGPTTVTAVPDQRQQLSVAVDARTNTLIVSGTARYLEQVRELVNRLDNIEATERLQTVYHLKNARAREIAATLQEVFKGESDLSRSTLGPTQSGALARQLEAEVTVVGDENSNRLLIATSPRYMNKVMQLVEELDAAPPQVMIQVLLAEVTLDSEDTWGMDIRVGPFGGENYNAQSLGGGPGVASIFGVGNMSVSSADFSLLIRALQVQGKLQVLSRPEVMVNNNKTANIQVGDNIAIATGTERTPQGSTRADVERQDVGITLQVTPSISNDGFVRMDINPKISTLTQKITQISEDFSAPVINQRNVETTVTVKDGQSVIIGGLIQSSDQERRSKVPLLGDIPGLGALFSTSQTSSTKTELLVILTPRVVPGQGPDWGERIRRLNEGTADRLSDPSTIRRYFEDQAQQSEDARTIDLKRPGDRGPIDGDTITPGASPGNGGR